MRAAYYLRASYADRVRLFFPLPAPVLLRYAIPGSITLAALLGGLTAILRAACGDASGAVILVMIAAVLDGFDGTIARALHSTSRAGAWLDSIADFVSFGLAVPAVLVLTLALPLPMALAWAGACAWRLRRPDGEPWFHGAPTPVAALLGLSPVIAALAGCAMPASVALLIVGATAVLMVVPVPTMSTRQLRRPRGPWLALAIGGVLLVAACVVAWPWITLLVLAGAWCASVPITAATAWRAAR